MPPFSNITKNKVKNLIAEFFAFVDELVPCPGYHVNIEVLDFCSKEVEIVFPCNDCVGIAVDHLNDSGSNGFVADLFFPGVEVVKIFEEKDIAVERVLRQAGSDEFFFS